MITSHSQVWWLFIQPRPSIRISPISPAVLWNPDMFRQTRAMWCRFLWCLLVQKSFAMVDLGLGLVMGRGCADFSLRGTPMAGWFLQENPIEKRMITRATPMYGQPAHPLNMMFGICLSEYGVRFGQYRWSLECRSSGLSGWERNKQPAKDREPKQATWNKRWIVLLDFKVVTYVYWVCLKISYPVDISWFIIVSLP